MNNIRQCITLILASTTALISCGGGGGGGDGEFIGAAQVSMQVSPQRIDSGDRSEVKIDISQVHKNGIALKVRFPKGLDYVSASSFLEVDQSDIDVNPTVNQEKESAVYLVYYISPEILGKDETGTLFFEIEGKADIEDGAIEVDPDVDDPAIDNAVEFSIEEPQFGAEEEASIEVVD